MPRPSKYSIIPPPRLGYIDALEPRTAGPHLCRRAISILWPATGNPSRRDHRVLHGVLVLWSCTPISHHASHLSVRTLTLHDLAPAPLMASFTGRLAETAGLSQSLGCTGMIGMQLLSGIMAVTLKNDVNGLVVGCGRVSLLPSDSISVQCFRFFGWDVSLRIS